MKRYLALLCAITLLTSSSADSAQRGSSQRSVETSGRPGPANQAPEQRDNTTIAAGVQDAGLEAIEQDLEDATERWRQSDSEAIARLMRSADACAADIEKGLDNAMGAVRAVAALKRDYYQGLFEWYGKRYQSTATILADLQPQSEVLSRQTEALRAEREDLKGRERALGGRRTENAKAALQELLEFKERQILDIEEARQKLLEARGKVQDERRAASEIRAKLAELMRSVSTEETLFDAIYRSHKASGNYRCTTEGKKILILQSLPRKGGAR